MSYTVKISDDGHYVLISAEVDVTTDIARKWTADAVALAKKNGIKKFLTDVRKVKNISNVTSNYHFSYQDVQKLEFDRSSRSAILVDPDDHSHDFIETTMMNAGYNVKIFFDEIKAVEWLEKPD